MIEWFVANTHAHAENKAAGHLLRQGFSVYLPKYLKLRSHARRKEWVPRPLFPRYLFVKIGPENARWGAIKSTIGISQLVCSGGLPIPVDSEVIEALQAREDDKGMVVLEPESRFKKGEPVKFLAGALCEQRGLFDHIDDNDRVIILLELLGRQISVRAPIEDVQACA
jgi:transcriptional antiterminator RfaH